MNTNPSSPLRRILYWIGGAILAAVVLALATYYLVLPTYSKVTQTHVSEKAVTPKGYTVTTIPGLVSAVGANDITITPYAGVALPPSMTIKFSPQTVFMIPGPRKDQVTYQKDQAAYQKALNDAEIANKSTADLQQPTIFTFTEEKSHTFSVGDMVYVHVSSSQSLATGVVTADSISLNESAFPAPTAVSTSFLPSIAPVGNLSFKPFQQVGAALLALGAYGGGGTYVAAPSVTFTSNTNISGSGQPVVLSWSIVNATACESSGFDNGGSTTSGSVTVYPTVTTTYSITCDGSPYQNGNATAAVILADFGDGSAPERTTSVTVSVYTPPAPMCPYSPPNGGQWQNIVANYATDGGITDHTWVLAPGQYFTGLQLKENCDDYSSENGCVDMEVQSVPSTDIFYPTNDNGVWTGFLGNVVLDLPAGQYISGLGFRSNCDYYSTEDGCMNVQISTANASTSPYRSNGGVWTSAGGYPNNPPGYSENAKYVLQPGQYISGIDYHDNCDNYSSEDDCIRIRVSELTTNDGLCGTTDLVAGGITAGSTSLSSGQSSAYSATVTNTGYASAKNFNSIIQIANASYTVLQSLPTNVLTLAGSASATVTSTSAYTFASTGMYEVRACADMNTSGVGTVSESNEGNNCGPWTAVTVSVPAAPNITAATGATVTGYTNQALTFSGTITNSGNAGAAYFPNSIHICDANCATVNKYVAASSLGSLAAGASQNVSGSNTFTTAGNYVYQMCGDTDTSGAQDITESNYGDNCGSWTAITVTTPTGGISATPNPCTITSGGTCTSNISWASTASSIEVWVQQNGGSETDFANGAATGNSTAPWIGFGSTYDFNMYDYSSGGRGAKLGTVRVTAAEANLTANQGATASSIVGQAVTLSSYVANGGTATATNFPNILQVCDNTSCTGSVASVLAANTIASLTAGSNQYVSASYTPTTNTQLYYRFCANNNTSWQNSAAESNYGDNCGAWANLNMGPAIPPTVTNPTTSCSADGTHVSIGWTAAPGATTYYPRFYAPTAAQCNSFGWQVWTTDGQTCYPNPDTWSQTSVNSFPVTPGQAYAWYVATGNSSGVNWTGVTTQNFTCAGAADLTAANSANTSGTAGTSLPFSGTVSNGGTGATTGGFWNLLQICNNTSCSSYNNITNEAWANTLANGASTPVSVNATLPAAGSYVYRFCANNNTSWQNIVTETNYGNNCGGWGTLTVASAVAPTVSCTPSSSSVNTGDSVTFTSNPSSTATGPYTWTDSDGTTGTGATFTRTYTTPGTYSMQVKGSNTPSAYCSPSQVQVAANYCTGGTPTLAISASPVRVKSGNQSTITWSGTNVQGQGASCTISGPGLTQVQSAGAAPSCSIAGGSQAVSITTQSTYCVQCGATKQCTTVNVIPKFNEF